MVSNKGIYFFLFEKLIYVIEERDLLVALSCSVCVVCACVCWVFRKVIRIFGWSLRWNVRGPQTLSFIVGMCLILWNPKLACLFLATWRELSTSLNHSQKWSEDQLRWRSLCATESWVTYPGHPRPEKHTGKECNLRTWDKPSSIKNTLPKGVTESYGYSQYFSESEPLLPKLDYGWGWWLLGARSGMKLPGGHVSLHSGRLCRGQGPPTLCVRRRQVCDEGGGHRCQPPTRHLEALHSSLWLLDPATAFHNNATGINFEREWPLCAPSSLRSGIRDLKPRRALNMATFLSVHINLRFTAWCVGIKEKIPFSSLA